MQTGRRNLFFFPEFLSVINIPAYRHAYLAVTCSDTLGNQSYFALLFGSSALNLSGYRTCSLDPLIYIVGGRILSLDYIAHRLLKKRRQRRYSAQYKICINALTQISVSTYRMSSLLAAIGHSSCLYHQQMKIARLSWLLLDILTKPPIITTHSTANEPI